MISPLLPYKLKRVREIVGDRPFRMLDVGAGNHSPSITVGHFPKCEYHGLDIVRDYQMNEADFRVMKAFYQVDLTKLDYSEVPDNHFDVIVIAHVIEHLYNGDEVLARLVTKLAPGGHLYIEYPGPRSLALRSMPMTLNFSDDPTHVRVYDVKEVANVLIRSGCTVRRAGTRRDIARIVLLPLLAVRTFFKFGHLTGGLFWDLMGFAEYVIARRKPSN
ncbi:methyltransferase domain-containing protein [bacterium]|nr:methyltransferase domain-containing protein [bacterium]